METAFAQWPRQPGLNASAMDEETRDRAFGAQNSSAFHSIGEEGAGAKIYY